MKILRLTENRSITKLVTFIQGSTSTKYCF